MIKVILFDADGVLIHQEAFSKKVIREYGANKDEIEYFFKNEFLECLVGGSDLKQIISHHLKKWGWKKSVDEYLDEWFRYEHIVDEPLIEEIKKIKKKGTVIGLATNQEKYRAEYMLKKMGFENIFDKYFISHALGHRKPQREFFEKVMKDLPGVNPEEILFWDDKEENIKVANSFGWNGHVYKDLRNFQSVTSRYNYH